MTSRAAGQRARRARERFSAHLKQFHSSPFLFVGSGFSQRYVSLPDWPGLLRQLAGYTDREYEYFVTVADSSFPAMASAIADRFHEVWWDSPEFEAQRAAHAKTLTSRESPLKVAIAGLVGGAVELPSRGTLGRELAHLRAAVIDGAVTTNYDSVLESVFPTFRVFVGQDQLLFSDPQRVGEIYKIHGSWDQPESLVITQRDFETVSARSPYLAATLLTLFVEHPVIFLGYSMSDSDIHEILVSVAKVLTTANLNRLADRLIFVHVSEDAAAYDFVPTSLAVPSFAIPVWSLTVPNYLGTFEALGLQKRKFPARLLRQLKEHIYYLVLENRPDSELFVQDIDAPTLPEGLEVVFGVGIRDQLRERGYVGLTRRDLLLDSLRDESAYVARRVVVEALPAILKSSGNVPLYRYLRGGGFLGDDGSLKDPDAVDRHVVSRLSRGIARFLPPVSARPRAQRIVASANSFDNLAAHHPVDEVIQVAGAIPRDEFPVARVRYYLAEHMPDPASVQWSYWAKLVCLCDYYAFGQQT